MQQIHECGKKMYIEYSAQHQFCQPFLIKNLSRNIKSGLQKDRRVLPEAFIMMDLIGFSQETGVKAADIFQGCSGGVQYKIKGLLF